MLLLFQIENSSNDDYALVPTTQNEIEPISQKDLTTINQQMDKTGNKISQVPHFDLEKDLKSLEGRVCLKSRRVITLPDAIKKEVLKTLETEKKKFDEKIKTRTRRAKKKTARRKTKKKIKSLKQRRKKINPLLLKPIIFHS